MRIKTGEKKWRHSSLCVFAVQTPSSSAQVIVRTKSRQSETVSQILQQTAGRTTPARVQPPASMTDQVRPAVAQPLPPKVSVPKTPGNMRWISSLGQTRLVMPSDKGIVITQLPSDSGKFPLSLVTAVLNTNLLRKM